MTSANRRHHERQDELINHYVNWQAVFGAQHFRCPNPSHQDDHPSVFVYPNGMHCFGCGWGTGDIWYACKIFLGWDRAKTRRQLFNFMQSHSSPRKDNNKQSNPLSIGMIRVWVDSRDTQDTKYLVDKYSVSSEILDLTLIGYTGNAFSIPHVGLDGRVWTVKFRRDDRQTTDPPKYWGLEGREQNYLFPAFALWSYLKEQPESLLLCESEFDALSALSHGYAALSVPSGSSTRLDKWEGIWGELAKREVVIYLAFDMDKAGQKAATKASLYFSKFPSILTVRASWDDANDLAELFVKGGIIYYE